MPPSQSGPYRLTLSLLSIVYSWTASSLLPLPLLLSHTVKPTNNTLNPTNKETQTMRKANPFIYSTFLYKNLRRVLCRELDRLDAQEEIVEENAQEGRIAIVEDDRLDDDERDRQITTLTKNWTYQQFRINAYQNIATDLLKMVISDHSDINRDFRRQFHYYSNHPSKEVTT
tara:strand:+ start:358 stop:873 length:516 start_codon:yes stop_codon:yes gene_type:complete